MSAPLLRRAEALVGLPVVPGEFDCAHLALRAQRELFGRELAWPLPGRHPQGRRGQAAAFARWRPALARKVDTEIDTPASGDAVLFEQPREGGSAEWHIGTLIVDDTGERWVLHTRAGVERSVLERLADCRARALRVEGIYRWTAAA